MEYDLKVFHGQGGGDGVYNGVAGQFDSTITTAEACSADAYLMHDLMAFSRAHS